MNTISEQTYQERTIAGLSLMLGYRRADNPCKSWAELGCAAVYTYIVPTLCVGIPAAITIGALVAFPFIQRIFHH